MDVRSFTRRRAEVLPVLLCDITLQAHAVERPLVPVRNVTKTSYSGKARGCLFNYPDQLYLLAMACMMAVRKDWGLKKPASHTAGGKMKSTDQVSSSLILARRSLNHRAKPDMEGYALLVQLSGTASRKMASCRFSISLVMVSSP